MIPARLAPIVFAFILSGLMSLLVSGVVTLRTIGLPADFVGQWLGAWVPSWMVAFPAAATFAPIARRIVARFTNPS